MTNDQSLRATPALTLLIALLASPGGTADANEGDGIVLLPSTIRLTGPRARQSLLVQRIRGNLLAEQLTGDVTLASSDPAVVTVSDGVAVPVADGAARLTATSGDRIASAALAFGGLAHKPWRDARVEEALAGQRPTPELFDRAADILLADARGQGGNDFKIPLARRTLAAVLAQATGAAP